MDLVRGTTFHHLGGTESAILNRELDDSELGDWSRMIPRSRLNFIALPLICVLLAAEVLAIPGPRSDSGNRANRDSSFCAAETVDENSPFAVGGIHHVMRPCRPLKLSAQKNARNDHIT